MNQQLHIGHNLKTFYNTSSVTNGQEVSFVRNGQIIEKIKENVFKVRKKEIIDVWA